MRIAIVANPHFPVPPKTYGGSENVAYYLIKGLIEKGHEPILLGTGDSKVVCEHIAFAEKSMPYPKQVSQVKSYEAKIKAVNKNTEKLIKALLPRVDIIHSMGFDLKNFQNFPNLTTLHNAFQFEDIDYFKRRSQFPYVSISNSQRGGYMGLNYIRTVYNGMDPAEFPLVSVPKNYFSFISRFEREKGPHLAIQLAINLGVKIKLGGKLDYHGSSYFKEEIEPYINHPLVEYLGELRFEQKVRLLSNAKLNLHPISWREPFGLTVMEAGYCGTPTLAMRRGSMPEVIDRGKTGYLVEDFIEGLNMVEKCLKLDRGEVAKRMRSKFNYQKMTIGYLRAYKKALREFDSN